MDSPNFYTFSDTFATFDRFVPAPCFKRVFDLPDVKEATLEVCTPGFYELFVNGKRVTRGALSPYIADPDDVMYVDTYDLAPYLTEGKNVISLLLGNGILNCVGGYIWNFDKAPYRAAPMAAVSFKCGNVTFDASSFVWKPSAIQFDDIRAGEWYDARRESDDLLSADTDDTWQPVIPARAPRGKILPNRAAPILVEKELTPVSVRRSHVGIWPDEQITALPEDERGEGYLYDFGINTAGVCRLKIKNTRPGQKIVLQFGEILGENPSGGADTTLRTPDAGLDLRGFHYLPHRFNNRDVYICRGGEEEIWQPYFTYHGFRYVLVYGLDESQAADDLLTYLVMHTDMETRASFRCSDETANRIFDACVTADKSNFFHFPTDCPHREKNVWTGDAYLSAEQMLTAFGCENNLKQWLRDIRAAMNQNGDIPGIVPTVDWGFGLGVVWGSVIVELPYRIYTLRDDVSVIRENAAAMLRFLNYIAASRWEDGMIHTGLGDWCQAARGVVDNPKAPSVVTSTAAAMDDCRKCAEMFRTVGMTAQAVFADELYAELKKAARAELLDANNALMVYRCQTAQAAGIWCGMFEPWEIDKAVGNLLAIIHENDDHIDCGSFGLRILFRVLADHGEEELAYRMITRTDFPSYGYMVENGATALHELFFPMERVQSSCNHHFYGDVLAWFTQTVTGITYEKGRLRIRPRFIGKLDFAEGHLVTPKGKVEVKWRREGNGITLDISLDKNMAADVYLPSAWQSDDGFTKRHITSDASLSLIPSTAPDKLKRFAK